MLIDLIQIGIHLHFRWWRWFAPNNRCSFSSNHLSLGSSGVKDIVFELPFSLLIITETVSFARFIAHSVIASLEFRFIVVIIAASVRCISSSIIFEIFIVWPAFNILCAICWRFLVITASIICASAATSSPIHWSIIAAASLSVWPWIGTASSIIPSITSVSWQCPISARPFMPITIRPGTTSVWIISFFWMLAAFPLTWTRRWLTRAGTTVTVLLFISRLICSAAW